MQELVQWQQTFPTPQSTPQTSHTVPIGTQAPVLAQ